MTSGAPRAQSAQRAQSAPYNGAGADDEQQRRAARAAYVGWCLFLAVLLLITTTLVGVGVDWLQPLSPRALFAALMLASLLGSIVASLAVGPWFVRPWERWLLLLVLYAAWRVSYLPLLQLSSLGASCMAGVVLWATPLGPWIYPTLLGLLGLLHVLAGLLAAGPLAARRVLLAVVAWPILLLAAGVSLTGWEDLHPLPDRGYRGLAFAATAALPDESPFRSVNDPAAASGRDQSQAERPRRRGPLWILAGATSLDRTEVPWSAVLQGTLERELRARPPVSSSGFLRAWYAASIAAHDQVGCRKLLAQLPQPGGPSSVRWQRALRRESAVAGSAGADRGILLRWGLFAQGASR
ncbi:MAG: hypothetical protein J5I93_20395 [Pirellulaceae bacterium]|nr:hypothetical protein [Pirellulaceae bacterium]